MGCHYEMHEYKFYLQVYLQLLFNFITHKSIHLLLFSHKLAKFLFMFINHKKQTIHINLHII